MSAIHPHDDASHPPRLSPGSSKRLALLAVAAVGGFYLLREHWDHLGGAWIYLLLLACPLMHLFHGHGGHGHGSGRGASEDRITERDRGPS